jgi:hypothetical protein
MDVFGNGFDNNYICVHDIVKSFINNYYGKIKTSGWGSTSVYYSHNCRCSVNLSEFTPNELFMKMANDDVNRANFDSGFASYKKVGDNIFLTVSYYVTYIGFSGTMKQRRFAVDTFIISASQRRILNHDIHLRTQ